ncbi:ethanolamine ammonia-lyase subunit EutC [Azoarcus olearius]|uniref:Ethanolamine ammonia-lyase small subunit n=1 Tax=Azoarcus sp. (strain BH72) TaxID=418699 RepID=A1KC90_AZOSB|nr:ethanolamine ammonia-lyase subunit EutC [Azoarcus olearius]CAL96446.1 putative ethanolamine ammonia-lyase small subunit [Azoarcus olearius]
MSQPHIPPHLDADPWADLRAYTAARLALGRAGASLPTAEVLRFGLAHAQARDAVHIALDTAVLQAELAADGFDTLLAHSAAPDRGSYLARPDLGRRLADDSAARLRNHATTSGCDLLLVIGDGLSSLAVARNARPLVAEIRRGLPAGWTLGPVVIATQARVALADEIGQALGARLVAMLIGERPGLSSPDSLGAYLTWAPQPGRSDAQRNCISNIRPEGLGYAEATRRLWWLCAEARRLGLTGVALKDNSDSALPGADTPPALPAADGQAQDHQ